MLFNPATASFAEYYLTPFKVAVRSFAVEAIAAPVRDLDALATTIADLRRQAE
jgi:putative tryptophan/tyrosine transport system substrate-binding protein